MKNIVAVVVSLLWLAAIVVWIGPLNDFLECQMSGECHSRGGGQ